MRFNPENYVDVQERIDRFWREYPNGSIRTELMSLPDEFERVVFRASVYKRLEDAEPAATGWAAEVAGTQGANQTSWHENGETSAIGRALANMGYATNRADRPSRQEMDKVARGAREATARPSAAEAASRPVVVRTEEGSARPEQIKQMWILARALWPGKHESSGEDLAAYTLHNELLMLYGKDSSKKLSEAEAKEYIETLKAQDAARLREQHQTVMAGVPDEPAHIRDYTA